LRELKDIPHRGTAEAVQALVLVPNYTEVATLLCDLEEELLLDVVGVLVLVYEDIPDVVGHSVRRGAVPEQVMYEPLQVGEVCTVGVEENALVSAIGVADGDEEGIGGTRELLGIDEFLRDLVEVAPRPFDGRPPGLPAEQKEIVLRQPYDLVEVLEDEKELRQLV